MGRKLQSMEALEAINLVRLCQAMNALPLAGGLFDQDCYFVHMMQIVLAADGEKLERESKSKGSA